MEVFQETNNVQYSAYVGWQDNAKLALLGIKAGFKDTADTMVNKAIENKRMDTYVFPIMFSYRHALEVSLKAIYVRGTGELPAGGHNLTMLWEAVREDIIDGILLSKDCENQILSVNSSCMRFSFSKDDLEEITQAFDDIQKATDQNQQIDSTASVWRYLVNKSGNLYFTYNRSIDLVKLKEIMGKLYDKLDFIYMIIDDKLSS